MSANIIFLPVEDMIFESVVSSLSETEDWGLIYAGIPEAHKHSKGKGVTVAILDTGASSHIDLNTNIKQSFNSSDMQDYIDRQGHGTHVAGIIAAAQNNTGIIGVAPEAKIMPIKVLNDNGTGGYDNIARGIKIAIDNGADIINMSLGAPNTPPSFVQDVIKEAYDKGIIIVAAAGNDSGAVNYPAKFDEVLAVGAIGADGKLANFSSRGNEVACVAPGVNVYSTYLNGQYAILNGTSQASPFMAGVCALLLSWSRNNSDAPQINNAQDMLKLLDNLCDPVGRIGFEGKQGVIGYGIPQFANFMPWK